MTDEQASRVRNALAAYKKAQAEQAQAVSRSNGYRHIEADASRRVATGDLTVVECMDIRADCGMAIAMFERAAAEVWVAAADLVRALDAAGFGDES